MKDNRTWHMKKVNYLYILGLLFFFIHHFITVVKGISMSNCPITFFDISIVYFVAWWLGYGD